MFIENERPELAALPDKPFEYFKIGVRKVHVDGHIEVDKAYYSVPHQYLGQTLVMYFNSQWVKVLKDATLLACHRNAQPGRFQTERQHLPKNKTLTQEEFRLETLNRCARIGSHCRLWAGTALKERQELAFRAIKGRLAPGANLRAGDSLTAPAARRSQSTQCVITPLRSCVRIPTLTSNKSTYAAP